MPFTIEYLVKFAAFVLKAALEDDLVDEIQQLIDAAFDWNMSGEEKKKKVIETLKAMAGTIGDAVEQLTPWLLNLVIEILVAKTKIERGEPAFKRNV